MQACLICQCPMPTRALVIAHQPEQHRQARMGSGQIVSILHLLHLSGSGIQILLCSHLFSDMP